MPRKKQTPLVKEETTGQQCQCVAQADGSDPERLQLWKQIFPPDGKVPIIGDRMSDFSTDGHEDRCYLVDFDRVSPEQKASFIQGLSIKCKIPEAQIAADIAAVGAPIQAKGIIIELCPMHEPKKEPAGAETPSEQKQEEIKEKRVTTIIRSFTQKLTCKLTDDEVRNAGTELAAVVQDIAAEKERQADVNAQMKARLTELQSKQTQLAIKVSRREDFRDIKVEYEINEGADIVTERRLDTSEVMTVRPARDDERQLALGEKPEEIFAEEK